MREEREGGEGWKGGERRDGERKEGRRVRESNMKDGEKGEGERLGKEENVCTPEGETQKRRMWELLRSRKYISAQLKPSKGYLCTPAIGYLSKWNGGLHDPGHVLIGCSPR